MSLNIKSAIQKILLMTVILTGQNGYAVLDNLFSDTLSNNKFEKSPNNFESFRPRNDQVIGKGIIQAKSTIEDLPGFRVYFNGNVAVSDDCGFFSFPVEDTDLSKYRLVITRRLEHVFDKQNTINNFKVIPDKDYMCYTFKKHGRYGSWEKKIKPLNHKNFALPKNSIVLLMSPKYVDHIEEWDIELTKNVLKMPKIVLKSNISEKELQRVTAKSLLCIEDTVFHEKVGRENNQDETKNNKVKVTLP